MGCRPFLSAALSASLAAACLAALAPSPALASPSPGGDPALAAWRAGRRQAVRQASLAAVAGTPAAGTQDAKTLLDPAPVAARFGLLVIPVDFADHRLPEGWDPASLSPRLGAAGGQSLRHYFDVASAGRCEVVTVLAPLARLPGRAADYSDIGWNGFSRSRRLAREALQSVAGAGFDLGLADLDGPDGLPRSGDDDGWVDGVLVLHAEAGQENDPEAGLVQALQYYLDEPVTAGGVAAGAYAVASLHSGPGIWAHETAHLLGLEDRYDPLLDPLAGAGDIAGAGGLGVFSLMGAGAVGTGGGWGASLPDAYSRALLGWCDVRTVTDSPVAGDTLRAAAPGAAEAHRAWTRDGAGPEFLLLEARDPQVAAPFDAALPGAGMVVLHIDESVPEGGWSEDGPGAWHLRARLVEADGDGALAHGLEAGSAGDPFPGSAGRTALTPLTTPSSGGYGGPSGVSINGIAVEAGRVVYRAATASSTWFSIEAAWTGEGPVRELAFTAAAHGPGPAAVTLRVESVGAASWGSFAAPVSVALTQGGDGLWRPVAAVAFETEAALPDGAATRFRYELSGPGLATSAHVRDWAWTPGGGQLDFAAAWPGAWTPEQPDGAGTAWARWDGASTAIAGGRPVLACTGESALPAQWPGVGYTNDGRARLTSGPLGAGVAGVRLVHWVGVEVLPGGVPMDGAVVSWVAPDGREEPATPVGGWPARVAGGSGSALRGRGSFGREPGELDGDARPVWRSDAFVAPPAGEGPWRLRLELAANSLWRGRGWLLADVAALADAPAAVPGNLDWDGARLAWDWEWPAGVPAPTFDVQARVPPDSSWVTVMSTASTVVTSAELLPLLPGAADARHELRVTGPTAWGTLALAPVVAYVDGGGAPATALGMPWPNPAPAGVRLALSVPGASGARVLIHDLRGRLVRALAVAQGASFVNWDGCDASGRRQPSGTYIIRLEGAGTSPARKVVLTH